jgi:hypothetical protein
MMVMMGLDSDWTVNWQVGKYETAPVWQNRKRLFWQNTLLILLLPLPAKSWAG